MLSLVTPFFCLATGISANKMIYFHVGPMFFTAIRLLISGLLMTSFISYNSGKDGIKNLLKRVYHDLPYILVITCLTTLIQSLLKAYALANTLSSKVALIGSLDPFITALFCWMFWDQRLVWQQWLGITIGFCGSAILILGKTDLMYPEQLFGLVSYAELAALASFMMSRLGWMQIQKLLKHNRYTSEEINAITQTLGGLGSLFVVRALEPASWCTPINWTWELVGLIFYTIIIGNVLGYNLYGKALKKFSSPLVSIVGLLIPIIVYIIGVLFIGEPMYGNFLVSLGCIAIALALFYSHEPMHKSHASNE